MSALEEQLQQILSDPEQLAGIQRMARSLMGGGETPGAPPSDAQPPARPFGIGAPGPLPGAGGDDDKTALLRAMKPWLSQKRQAKLDRALRMAQMARMARLAMRQMGEDGDGGL